MVWAAVITGFIAGVVHVFSGPDHLAAVAPFSLNKVNRASRTGFQWGLGHCAGVALIGFLALVFREMFSLESVSFWAEKFVGLMLVGIGAWGICRGASRQLEVPRSAPFAIGTVHGLAGSSHLIGVLPALMFPSNLAVGAYIVAFGAGTIAAMTGFARLVAALPQRAAGSAMMLSSCAAVMIGCYWLIA